MAMGALVPINRLTLESFGVLREGGVVIPTYEAKSFLAAHRTESVLARVARILRAGKSPTSSTPGRRSRSASRVRRSGTASA
jgi:hypothetical protein